MVGFDDRAEEVEEVVDSDPLVEEGEVDGDLVIVGEMALWSQSWGNGVLVARSLSTTYGAGFSSEANTCSQSLAAIQISGRFAIS